MTRLQNARKEEQVKRHLIEKGGKQISSRLIKSSNLRANSQENLYSFHEDSQSNMGCVIKNLHRSLHAFEFNE